MNLHKLSKRHSIHSMQQPPASSTGTATGRQADEFSGADATTSGGKQQQQQQQQRKKGKFRLKERSCSSVRERFVNDPAYTEDVRHLALPMRRNSGPEHHGAGGASSRRFYTMPKKKSNSVGKDYLRSSSGSRGSREFYTVDVTAELARVTNTPEPVDQSNVQVKVRRKKYNYHNSSAEMLRFNDESSSSDNLRKSKSSTLERRGRSLDRRGLGDREPTGWFQREGSRKEVEEEERTRGRNRNVMRRQNAAGSTTPDSAVQQEDEDAMYRAAKVAAQAAVAAGEDVKESKSKFQIGKRFLKGEIGIKSFNYYLLKEGLKSSKKNLLKQKSAPVEVVEVVQPVVVAVPQERRPSGLSKSEENIYEEIYFEEKPGDSTDEKIQFIDCELCVQECNNSNCEVCHSHVPKHKLQQHHHHQQHQQLPLPPPPQVPKPSVDKQNIYEQLKQIPLPGTPGPPPPYQAVEGGDLSSIYHSSSSMTYGSSPGNVLQYQSYNPKNPNVFKIETTPVAFSCDYNPIQQIYYKPGYGSVQQQRPQHIYQRPHNLTSSSQSDFYQEVNRKKSSSSSDSLQARMQRELYQQASLYYYQQAQKQAGASSSANPSDPSKIYKTNSNASILSEASAKSENSLKHPQRTGNMSDSSLGDSLFSYPANRRYFGSSESCRFASECRRCSLDVDKCSYSDTCRYDCRNCDCSSSYFSSDFDDPTAGGRKSGSRQDNYGVPAYAEDFMKHVNNVKRNQLGQQKQTASGKIYETPTTYVGVSKKTHHEHTYETLKNNVILYQQPYKSIPKYEESSRLSISQSHELLLSPSRSKIPLESRYSLGGGPPSTAISRYGYAKSSSTLPAASSFASKTRSTEFFPQAGSLPKATLSKLNHDYAEIVQLPTPAAPPKDPKRSSNVKYTAPQPPKPATTPTTRRQAPPIPANPPLASDPLETRSIGGGSDRDKSLPRKDRADFEKSKRGAAAAVAASLQDQPQEKKESQQVQQLTVAPAKKEKKERRHPARKKVEDDGNFTDDEDDEVFLSERSNEKLRSGGTRKENPPKEQTTTNAAAVAGSAEPSSQPPPKQQPKQTVSSTTPQKNSPNESESLRTLASERASDRRVSDGGGVGGPSKIAKTTDALSSDLAVPGETSARLTVPTAAASDQAVPSNRYER